MHVFRNKCKICVHLKCQAWHWRKQLMNRDRDSPDLRESVDSFKYFENFMWLFFMICTNITNSKREGKCGLDAVNMYYKCKIFMPFILLKNVIMIQCAVKII